MDVDAKNYIERLYARACSERREQTWYCIAACAFTACNQGKYVAEVYRQAIKGSEDVEFRRCILKRIKESLLKTGIIYGIPRLINAFRALVAAIPTEADNETSSVRQHIHDPTAETDDRGLAYMRNIFRADLDPFLDTMNRYWPDLKTLVVTTIYGYYQSDITVIDAIVTSQLNIASLVPMDVVAEVAWHMRGVIRNGGTREDLDFAFEVATEVCKVCAVSLRNTMPKPDDVVEAERLF